MVKFTERWIDDINYSLKIMTSISLYLSNDEYVSVDAESLILLFLNVDD